MQKEKPDWMKRLLNSCEEVGVSKIVIERFFDFYLTERRIQDARLATTAKGTKRTSS